MPFINRYTVTTRGCITITGNTLGLSKSTTGSLTPGTSDAIGGFITTNISIPTATGWSSIANLANNENVTLDWTQNSASAKLNILNNSTILYAELIWGGAFYLGTLSVENVSNYINNSIKFTTPEGRTYNIAPDSSTSYTVSPFYSRSANVTSLITTSGTYTVGAVPAALSTNDATSACAGWSLIVVYSNTSLPIRNMSVFSGGEAVSTVTVDTNISGFATPVNGAVSARISVSSIEGDGNRVGDYMQFGPSILNLKKLYGPNNWAIPPNTNDNFFNSQINNGDPNSANVGKVDTTGTFGNRNTNTSQATPVNITGGRQGWSITNVDGSQAMANNQTSAVVRLATTGDVYIPNAFAVQIDSAYATINIQKSTSDTLINAGDTIHYKLTISNTGTLATNDFLIYDPVLTGDTIDVSSIVVSGATGSIVNNSTSTGLSIQIGPLLQNQVVTISYNLLTHNQDVFPIQNTAYGQYTYTPATGVSPVTDTKASSVATTNGVMVSQSKSVSNSQAVNGDIITYTINIDNTASSVDITNVSLVDILQSGTTYILNSTVIGSNPPINSDPNSGINIGIVPAQSTKTVSFNVLVNSQQAVSPITNTAKITFTGAGKTTTQYTNTTSVYAINPSVSVTKSVDKILAQVGDTLKYTIVITNTGDTILNNIIFNDPLPANTTYDNNGVTIDTVLYPSLNPNNTIDLLSIPVKSGTFPLYPGNSVTISYTVNITSSSSNNQISNIASVTSSYKVGTQQRSSTIKSNNITTDIFKLNIIKTTDRISVEEGDLFKYTITITSTKPGTYANNIIFIDNFPPNVTMDPGSTNVNGVNVVSNNSTPTQINLNLGNTFPNNPITISATVKAGSGSNSILENTASVNIGNVSANSNTISTKVAKPNFVKSSSNSYVTLGQVYTYTVTIDNTNNQSPLTEVYVYDPLQQGISYILSSTKIGTNAPINANPSIYKGINIGTVAKNTSLTVSFNVIVDTSLNQSTILNTATINYNLDLVAKTKNTNQTTVIYRFANTVINKESDNQYADIGDTINYKLTAINTGNVSADSVKITDVVPSGTTFEAGSIVVKDQLGNALGFSSSIIGTNLKINLNNSILQGSSAIITFRVKVDNNIPIINPIANKASVNFDYIVDPSNTPINTTNTSNTVNTQILNANLISPGNFIKSVDKQYSDVGDIITYTIIAKNTGNTDANNVVIKDSIPVGTSIIPGSIVSNYSYTGENMQLGITLNDPVRPGAIVIIIYKVKVDVLPSQNPILNFADINYTYTVNPLNPNGLSSSGSTNTVTTKVNHADISNDSFNKSVDKTIALIGDTITYTINASNTGNTPATSVVVVDKIPNGTTFNIGSTTVNGVSTSENPDIGINIAKIDVGEDIVIIYKVTITSLPQQNPIPNIANVTYNYLVDPTKMLYATSNSTTNKVNTSVSEPNLIGADDFTKTVDKEYANVGDTLTYTITVHNSSLVLNAKNVKIIDEALNNTDFIGILYVKDKANSTLIAYIGDLQTTGITITNGISQNQEIELAYQVKVSSLPVPNKLLNYAKVNYTYDGGTGNAITNTTTTTVYTADLKSPGNFIKQVDKVASYVGDILTYHIGIKNTGNISANNVLVKDILPDGTSLVLGSLVIHNPYTGDNIVSGITLINPIQPGEVIDITFKVKVENITVRNPIENYASLDYYYTVDPNIVNGVRVSSTVGPILTKVSFADLTTEFTKNVDKDYIDIGGILTYTISVKNTGNAKANNVLISDVVPIETNLINIASVTDLLGNPISYLGDLETVPITIVDGIDYGSGVIINFKVKVMSIPPTNYILNSAKVDYNYILDSTATPPTIISGSGISNQVSTKVNDANLSQKFIKTVNTKYADIGDILIYTIKTINSGNISTINTTDDNQRVKIVDIIQEGTTLLQSTISVKDRNNADIQYKQVGPDLTLILIDSVDVDEEVIVNYQVTVDKVPQLNKITNTSNISYSYEVNPITGEIDTDNGTSEVITIVNNADLKTNFIKTVDKQYANVGDILTYTVTTTNIGNVDATNVLIIDELQPGESLVPGSMTITDGNTNPLSYTGTVPSHGIRLVDPVVSGETITFIYQVRITSIPSPNPISNIANIFYDYVVDTQSNTIVSANKTTNPAATTVQNANLTANFIKSVDKQYADVGTVLTYTIRTTNIGNVKANNVKITDSIPLGTIFQNNITVTDSLGNPIAFNGDNPEISGVSIIDGIDAGHSIILIFSVLVTQIPQLQSVINTANITYDYELDTQTIYDSGVTNQVSTKINDTNLSSSFIKSVDKNYADVGDILTYTIIATNTGNTATIKTDDDTKKVIIEDIIPEGTTLIDSSIAVKDASGNDLDYKKGSIELTIILINPIDVSETVIVTYNVIVDKIPTQNPILNKADITYTYEVDPTNHDIDTDYGTTPNVTTMINHANVIVDKDVDKKYADVNDILTYTLTIKNDGNTDVISLMIIDDIQPGTSFVQGSVTSSVEIVGNNPSSAIGIVNPISPGSTIIVSYKVIVLFVPDSNLVVNIADITYRHTVDQNHPGEASNSIVSGPAITEIYNANLAAWGSYINKSVDEEYADRGNILTYTIVATNTGNTEANNVTISDIIPQGAVYVLGSIAIINQMGDPIDFDATNPSQIQINEPISKGKSLKLTFKVQVDQNTIPTPNPMENIANISYDYTVDPQQPNAIHTDLISLPVLTQVNFANLIEPGNFVKEVDKEYADIGDTLNYTLTIRNTGNTSANNVVITDILPTGTNFVKGSLSSNVETMIDNNITKITIINPIYDLDTVVINYQVLITNLPDPNPIENIATINYYYTVDPTKPNAVSDSGVSNPAVTQINTADLVSNFKKSVDNEYAILGDEVNYTLTIKNTGNTKATHVNIKDVIPVGLTLIGPISITDNQGNSINYTGDIQTSGIILESEIEPVDNLGYPDISINIPLEIQSDTMPLFNPLINSANISYNYTVDPSEVDRAYSSGNSNKVMTFIICETVSIEECLLVLAERIEVKNINVLKSHVHASVIKTNLDKNNIVYKNYQFPSIVVSGYNLYIDINLIYYIGYNTSNIKVFNEKYRFSIFIPKGMSNSNLYPYLNIQDAQLYINGSRAGFYVPSTLRICVSDKP